MKQSNVNALVDLKLEKHKNLREESGFYWREISDGTLKFDRRDCEVGSLSYLHPKSTFSSLKFEFHAIVYANVNA